MTRKRPVAPRDLGLDGKRLWREITATYELSPAECELLRQACRTADLVSALYEELLDQPPMIKGSVGQMKLNPMIAAVADQRRLLDGLIRSLSLPLPDEEEGRRRSPQQREAAQARWRKYREERQVGEVG